MHKARPIGELELTVPEIVTAVQQQNTVNPAGKLGGEPRRPGISTFADHR